MCKGSGPGISATDDGCAIRVVFKDNGELEKMNFTCTTDIEDDAEEVRFDVYVGLREPCVYIAQTEEVPYTSAGWTDHLWKNSGYIAARLSFVINALQYPFSLLNEPFGSLGMSFVVPTQLVNIFTHYDSKSFDPVPAIVGSPYSCGPGSGNRCLNTMSNSPTPQTVNGPASNHPSQDGKTYLSTIFAKINSIWVWNNLTAKYDQATSTIENSWLNGRNPYNLTEYSGFTNANNVPQIHPLGTCKAGGKCLEASALGMSINDRPSGNVVFNNNVALVNAKFYGFANRNQMPIKKIKLDWGDQSIVSLDGYFRNHRGMISGGCGSNNTCLVSSTVWNIPNSTYQNRNLDTGVSCASNGECRYLDNCFAESIAPNFGQILGKTCDSAYFRFDHVYQCSRDGNGWTSSCPDAQIQSLYGGCCSFQPKVQLKDNWGWCNGTCGSASSAGGTACYDAGWRAGGQDECEQSIGAFTPFAGNVIVVPSE